MGINQISAAMKHASQGITQAWKADHFRAIGEPALMKSALTRAATAFDKVDGDLAGLTRGAEGSALIRTGAHEIRGAADLVRQARTRVDSEPMNASKDAIFAALGAGAARGALAKVPPPVAL